MPVNKAIRDILTRVPETKRTMNLIVFFSFVLFFTEGMGQLQRSSGTCPEKNGRFSHSSQCDAYTECEDGVPNERLCPEGLLFNPNARFFSYPCQYPIDVDCTGRSAVQPANATEECPHSYGFFKVGTDRASCGEFINCVEGKAYHFNCPEGLAFNPDTYQCDWPDQVASCDTEAFLGFACPEPEGAFSPDEFRRFRSTINCSKFFICVAGRPRLFSCPEGKGFSDETGKCEDQDQVPGCIFFSSSVEPFQN